MCIDTGSIANFVVGIHSHKKFLSILGSKVSFEVVVDSMEGTMVGQIPVI